MQLLQALPDGGGAAVNHGRPRRSIQVARRLLRTQRRPANNADERRHDRCPKAGGKEDPIHAEAPLEAGQRGWICMPTEWKQDYHAVRSL